MNFFGHATVAGWQSDDPLFVLGSMLPDFAAMSGNGLQRVLDSSLRAGVELHRATDQIFHRSPDFIELCSESIDSLHGRGVKLGSARAAAHAGVELLLDGVLSADQAANDSYFGALRAGSAGALADKIVWRAEYDRDYWQCLLTRLRSANIPRGYADPDFVARRLTDILGRRPSLALDPAKELPAVQGWVREVQPEVASRAPGLLGQVRRGVEIPAKSPSTRN